MRTIEQIEQIKSRVSDPYVIEDFISDEEINHLINIYKSSDNSYDANVAKVYKNTGPVVLNLYNLMHDKVISNILYKIKDIIGPYEITAAFFFETNYPHVIHNDDLMQLPNGIYKAITLPLAVTRTSDINEFPELCFFDQFYFHGPSKFFNGSEIENIKVHYNKSICDYSDVDGILKHNAIDDITYEKYFTHLKREWLDGLSLHSTLEWKPGSALIFDSTRLHAASDFRKKGISSKMAISIFTSICNSEEVKYITL